MPKAVGLYGLFQCTTPAYPAKPFVKEVYRLFHKEEGGRPIGLPPLILIQTAYCTRLDGAAPLFVVDASFTGTVTVRPAR